MVFLARRTAYDRLAGMPTSGPAAMAVQAGDAGQAFADALPDGILIADTHGRIVFANRQLAALSGYDLDELIGLPVETLVPARHRQAHQ
jgi:PAS domain-containing protein